MWRLVASGLYFACLLHEVITSLKPEFHTMLTKEERKRYLHTDSQDTVPEYDITRVFKHRRKRSSLSPQHEFRLSAFGRSFHLMVEFNDDVITDGVLPIERVTADGLLVKETHSPQGQFYVGHVTADPESHVAVRETNHKGQLSGAIISNGHLYEIEPLPHHLHTRAALKGNGYHVISRRSIKDLTNNETKSTPVEVLKIKEVDDKQSKDHSEPVDTARKRDDAVYQGQIYIETMLAADKTTCDFYGNGTLDYLLNTANLISRLYKQKSIGMQVSWVLVKVFLVEGYDAGLDFTANNIKGGGTYLRKFANWASTRNKAEGEAEHYDQAAMLTRRICGINSCYIDGLAYFNTPCDRKFGVSVNDASGLTAAYSVAHEMGHNLGLKHDSGTDCAKGYIMQASQAAGSNAHHWSPCSRETLRKIFTSHTCFHNKPAKQLPSPTLLPGYANDVDKQCQMAHGEEYTGCSSQKWSCGPLYCTKGGSCYSRGAPVAEGTVCGIRKWCLAGICTDVGSSLPPPVDGGWGRWGSYGECTRTCGGGVKYRSRQCNDPEPQYFGNPCKGSSRGHFKLCNPEECTVERFRLEQCEEHNSDTRKYRPHFLGGSRKCTLACASGSTGYYFGHVKDGTRCESNPHVYDVCINGQCNVVGCDKKLKSTKVYDRCLNCGGNGGSCFLIHGTYTKNYRVYGAKKGDIMFTIPKGATNVRILEMGKSYNFLSIVSNTTGKYYVPVPSWTNTYKSAGTSIYHYMKKYNDAEIILIKGPTNEALDAMYIYSGIHVNNPGISYSFYALGEGKSTKFHWKSKNEGGCSTTCAGGVQLIKVTCHRDDDETEVTPGYCSNGIKPVVSKPCNLAPCPKHINLGVWSPCSEPCGGGQQHRNLTCVQVVSKDVTKILPESECAHLLSPPSTQQCNNVDCWQEWILGEWTQCSVLCGNGTKTRSVECKKKMADGKWTKLPDDQCDDKPPSNMSCNEKPCYIWRMEYSCASCGGSNKAYVPIGCFRDRHEDGRPLPVMIGNHRKNINWYHMSETVKKCADDAWQKQFAVFGVQFYGECWSGQSGYVTYDKDGYNLQGCWEGVGRTHNNYVYAFTSLVSQPLVHCIYTVNNQTVTEEKCSSTKPLAKMKLCSQECKIGNTR